MPPISLALAAPSSSCRSKIATLAPAAASAEAVAPPNPDAPPVTMAACPLTFIQIPPCPGDLLSGPRPLAKTADAANFHGMSTIDQVAADEARVRRGFWQKARATPGKVPFTEDAVAAF